MGLLSKNKSGDSNLGQLGAKHEYYLRVRPDDEDGYEVLDFSFKMTLRMLAYLRGLQVT